MGRYRRVELRMWGDAKFRALSPPQPCGQALWIWMLTGPKTTNIPGVLLGTEAELAGAIGWPLKGFREAFREASERRMAEADWEAGLVWLPNAPRYNPPQSPNVVKGWAPLWDMLPECTLKSQILQALRSLSDSLPRGFRNAFAEAFGKICRIQEQEQDQEERLPSVVSCAEPKPGSTPSAPSEVSEAEVALTFPCTGPTREWGLTRAKLAEYAVTYETLDVEREARRALQWLRDNPGKRKTARGMTRFLNRWMANAVDRGHGPGKPPPEPPPFPTLEQMGGADGQAAADLPKPGLSHLRYLALEQLKARLEGSELEGAVAQVEAAVAAGDGPEVFRVVEAHGGQLQPWAPCPPPAAGGPSRPPATSSTCCRLASLLMRRASGIGP